MARHGLPGTDQMSGYLPRTPQEAVDLDRIRGLIAAEPDPWHRALPLHLTSSAVIVHPPTRRVLLRWHARQGAWLHVGGHADPGETDALGVAVREAVEETGLADVTPWPDPSLLHLAIVPVPASTKEPAHEHADLRFVLATQAPGAARPEDDVARLRWVELAEAAEVTASLSIRETLRRMLPLLG
jgi:8-oxo-dGTP pyrophosphatase MutT (NUDIX family)